jgi:hypothetical protein
MPGTKGKPRPKKASLRPNKKVRHTTDFSLEEYRWLEEVCGVLNRNKTDVIRASVRTYWQIIRRISEKHRLEIV